MNRHNNNNINQGFNFSEDSLRMLPRNDKLIKLRYTLGVFMNHAVGMIDDDTLKKRIQDVKVSFSWYVMDEVLSKFDDIFKDPNIRAGLIRFMFDNINPEFDDDKLVEIISKLYTFNSFLEFDEASLIKGSVRLSLHKAVKRTKEDWDMEPMADENLAHKIEQEIPEIKTEKEDIPDTKDIDRIVDSIGFIYEGSDGNLEVGGVKEEHESHIRVNKALLDISQEPEIEQGREGQKNQGPEINQYPIESEIELDENVTQTSNIDLENILIDIRNTFMFIREKIVALASALGISTYAMNVYENDPKLKMISGSLSNENLHVAPMDIKIIIENSVYPAKLLSDKKAKIFVDDPIIQKSLLDNLSTRLRMEYKKLNKRFTKKRLMK